MPEEILDLPTRPPPLVANVLGSNAQSWAVVGGLRCRMQRRRASAVGTESISPMAVSASSHMTGYCVALEESDNGLGGGINLLEAFPAKTKGMHWAPYLALMEQENGVWLKIGECAASSRKLLA